MNRSCLHAAVAVVCLHVASTGAAQSLPQLFSEGNVAFFQGDDVTAIARYQHLIEVGVDDADVYYNLGTAYARTGRCGLAIVALSRSLRLQPGDEGAEANLRACQTQLGKRRAQRDGEATVQTRPPWIEAMLASISLNAIAWIVLVLIALLFAVVLVLRWAHRDVTKLSLAVTAWLLALALALGASALVIKAEWLRDGRPAIVLREAAPLREGPDPRAKTRSAAFEGEPARILQRDRDFVRVRLARGAEGWMNRRDVIQI